MYLRLCDGFLLRGWQKLSGVLIKRPGNQYRILTQTQLRLLLLCDGVTQLDKLLPTLPADQQDCLKRWAEGQIIQPLDAPCPIAPEGAYHLYPNRFFHGFLWSITGKCNCRCRHCYLDAPHGAMGELNSQQALSLIDQMAACGALQVDLTGGEPLVRPDFWMLVDRLQHHHIRIGQLYTNGILLTRCILEEFQRRGLRPEIVLSFDGLGWHDWMRGVAGAEQAVWEAIRLCRELGFPVSCEMCLHRGNLEGFSASIRALGRQGVCSVKVSPVSDTALWKSHAQGNRLDFSDYVQAALDYIPQFYRDGMPCDLILSGIIRLFHGSAKFSVIPDAPSSAGSDDRRLLCGAIRGTCYIAPNGQVMPCMPMADSADALHFPYVQEQGLSAILSSGPYFSAIDLRLEDLLRENAECRECPYVRSCCGGCRASSVAAGNGLLGKDPSWCFLWRNNYVPKIRSIAQQAVEKYCNRKETVI